MKDLADELYFNDEDISALRHPTVAFEIPPTLVFPELSNSLFADDDYPVQIGSIDKSFQGEVQGTYWDKWKPSSSVYGFVRVDKNGKPKKHSGVDIYAPKGTPIVAITDGTLVQKFQSDNEAIGHRAWLKFKVNGEEWRFIYGHMDKFEGTPGPVKKGDIIGYSGCSGNASKAGCATKNKCGLMPDHVHLMLMSPIGKPEDPLKILKWKLRYLNPQPNDVDCSEVVSVIPA